MSKTEKSTSPTSTSKDKEQKEESPSAHNKDIAKILDTKIVTNTNMDSDTTEDEDDGMRVCVHCRRCFMSNGDLIPHCINSHFCDPSCFQHCLPSRYEKHNSLKTYRSLGLTIRTLGKRLPLKKCKDCNQIFICHFDYVNHAMEVHLVAKPYECACCNKCFDTVLNRVYHVMKAHGKRNINCKTCGKCIVSLHYIDSHLLKCNINTYECDKCAEQFASDEMLQSHMTKHEGGDSFQCDECEKDFDTKKKLKAHKKDHKNPPVIESTRTLRKRRKRKYVEEVDDDEDEEEEEEEEEEYPKRKKKSYIECKIKKEKEEPESDN
ncbi:zinc finger imprinted 3-like [Onthophagus taurus]|uniref:zinc finger imprinted 3-like n=1 Tax=Onthophagus taurus TaxID=166361 RepID=UPI000C208705|nr:gastrula zinc finger protein XlCGF17.1-like [Onthophagus taurus]